VPNGMPSSPGASLQARAHIGLRRRRWPTAEDISHWLAHGASTEAEAAAQRMSDLMGTISEGAYEAAWCHGLPEHRDLQLAPQGGVHRGLLALSALRASLGIGQRGR
jgi:hypothetical protein